MAPGEEHGPEGVDQEGRWELIPCKDAKALRLKLVADDPFLLASTSILAIGLEFIWENRKTKKNTSLFSVRAELETAISIRRRSRLRRVKETAGIMENILDNFFVAVNL